VLKQTETVYSPKNLRTKHQCPDSLFDKEEKGWSFLGFAYLAISMAESQALGYSLNHCPDYSLILKLFQPEITAQINRSISPHEIKKIGADRGYSELGFEQSWAHGIEDAKVYCVNVLIFSFFREATQVNFPTILFLPNMPG